MIKFVIIGVLAIVAGAAGYFAEAMFRPTPAPEPEQKMMAEKPKEKVDEDLFLMPLGKFTMQMVQNKRTINMLFDLDVFVMGAKNFEAINGAEGKAKLRDATVTAITEMAQTEQELGAPMEDEARKKLLAEKIVRRIYRDFPMVRTARLNSLNSDIIARQ